MEGSTFFVLLPIVLSFTLYKIC